MSSRNLYVRFSLFLAPLIITIFVQEVSIQWITAGLARLPFSVQSLAAFGLAWAISSFLTGPLAQTKQLSLVLVERRQSFGVVVSATLMLSGLIMAVQAAAALTPSGHALLLRLHRVSPTVIDDTQRILALLLLHPMLKGIAYCLVGPLIRNHHTRYSSYSAVLGFAAAALAVLLALRMPMVQAQPVLLPVMALYASAVTEAIVTGVGVWRHRTDIWRTRLHVRSETRPLTYGRLLRFFWPLGTMVLLQEFTRPLINLVIARQDDGELWLAVLAVVYALGQWPYRWLNETRTMASAFQHMDPQGTTIRNFNALAGLVSLLISLTLFWTPLRNTILLDLVGLEPELAMPCIVPLMIFAAFSPVVAVRSWMQGLTLVERRTLAVTPSVIARMSAIIGAVLLLPLVGLTGAVLGISTLLAGFIAEAATLVAILRGPQLLNAVRAGRLQGE